MKELEELRRYYERRTAEYEKGYLRDDAGFQAELVKMAEAVERTFVGRRVLEVACTPVYGTKSPQRNRRLQSAGL